MLDNSLSNRSHGICASNALHKVNVCNTPSLMPSQTHSEKNSQILRLFLEGISHFVEKASQTKAEITCCGVNKAQSVIDSVSHCTVKHSHSLIF